MKVYMIGKTGADLFPARGDSRLVMPGKAEGSAMEDKYRWENPEREKPWTGQALIEFAGRLCYESFDLPSEKTRRNSDYVRNIVALGHESVLEHVSVTFYVEGVSRNLTHELIRHRHLSFSELSQRYVDMENARIVIPPALREGWPDATWEETLDEMIVDDYEEMVNELRARGKSRKQAREAARSILPGGTETKIVVTGNLRAWRDVLKKRDSEFADAEIRAFAQEVKRQLTKEYPDVFKDLNEGSDGGTSA